VSAKDSFLVFLDFYRTAAGRTFLRRHIIALVIAALAILLLFELTSIDLALARKFFDAAQNRFPLKSNWLLAQVFHRGARSLSVLAGLALIGAALAAWVAPRRFARLLRYRPQLSFVAVALLAAPLIVGMLKHASHHSCPWDTAEFGGVEPYRHLLAPPPAHFKAEGCLPAAHPVSGYAWLAVALVLYPQRRAHARVWWWGALAVGLALGFVQMLRGAHFLSHILWSAWVVWAVDIALLRAALTFTRAHDASGAGRT
jgi:membrane-associated PAP2 superfamily phosphatase